MSLTIRHILLDIEGTTCPVSFVAEVLFPYALAQLPAYLATHRADARLQELRHELLTSWQSEAAPEARELWMERERALQNLAAEERTDWQTDTTTLLPYLLWLNRCDIKLTAWKDLQGLIWLEGYQSGALKATLFPEVASTLRNWHAQGLVLSVYSSGSVDAQKLLYGHTESGDLTPLFSHWFDTRIGFKNEPESYQRILDALGSKPDAVAFISDSIAELQAASALGIHCWLSARSSESERDSKRHCESGSAPESCGFNTLQELHGLNRMLAGPRPS